MFTIEEIARATGGTILGSSAGEVTGVSTDSRSVKPGELFVPLRGERFDGHEFISQAVVRGVRVCAADSKWCAANPLPEGATVVAVDDTLRALGDLAAFHRSRLSLRVFSVTGSNGKTTTKEMIAAILERTGPGVKTAGNLNNLIGLPHMLFRLSASDTWAVLEMGMSEPGEIDRLAEIAKPQVGVITNAFPAHLETMKSVEAVARAKGELFQRLPEGGCAIFNADDPLVAACPSPPGVHRLGFGFAHAAVTASDMENEGRRGIKFTLHIPDGEFPVRLKAFGRHNVANALAAAAAAVTAGLDGETIRAGLEDFSPYDKRFRLEELDGVALIDDTYNANPASVEAALRTLRDLKGSSRAIAVLGDMLELGAATEAAHRAVGRVAAECVERLYLLGQYASITAAGAVEGGLTPGEIIIAGSHEEILADLAGHVGREECLLVKGSRGMRMEVIAEEIRRTRSPRHNHEAVA